MIEAAIMGGANIICYKVHPSLKTYLECCFNSSMHVSEIRQRECIMQNSHVFVLLFRSQLLLKTAQRLTNTQLVLAIMFLMSGK